MRFSGGLKNQKKISNIEIPDFENMVMREHGNDFENVVKEVSASSEFF